MTKKRKNPSLEEDIARPWCYYCERDFDDLKILISHQKAKHLKCGLCSRRLGTAGGLGVHMQQVHKETLVIVENAIPGRGDPNVEIFGMEGIPADVVQAHKERVTERFYCKWGRLPGQNNRGEPNAKKIKVEEPEDLKKRLAEFKAKKAAEKAAEKTRAEAVATTDIQSATPQDVKAEPQFQLPSANPTNAFTNTFGHPASGGQPIPFGQPYGQPPGHYPVPYPVPIAGYTMPGPPQPGYPTYGPSPPMGGMPFAPQPFHQPAFSAPPPSTGFGRGVSNGGTNNPTPHPPTSQIQDKSSTGRQNSLPSAPGLPARPAFDAPPVSRHQMHELHQGQKVPPIKQTHEAVLASAMEDFNMQQRPASTNGSGAGHGGQQNGHKAPTMASQEGEPSGAAAVDRVNTVTNDAVKPAEKTSEKGNDSKSAKPKKKLSLVVKDHQTSPEEKMARMARYSFTPRKPEAHRVAPEGAAARSARAQGDVAQAA